MAPPVVVTAPDPGTAALLAAEHVAARLDRAVQSRGGGRLAVSGGRTPAAMFARLAELSLPWARIEIFQVDERVAPDGHPDRNATGLRRDLLDAIDIPAGNVHLMPVTESVLADAADAYGHLVTGGGPLDVVHLGLGEDGHTASWAPGDSVLTEHQRAVVLVGPYRGRVRMTITPPVVDRARDVVFLVDGPDKTSALDRLVAEDPGLTATRALRAHVATVFHAA